MLRVAVVGATGAVGREIVSAIFELEFPVSDLILASSPRSAGGKVPTPMGEITVTNTEISALEGADVAFLAAGASVSRKLAPELARRVRSSSITRVLSGWIPRFPPLWFLKSTSMLSTSIAA